MRDSIEAILLKSPDILYGYTDISYSDFSEKYKCALVLAVPYGKQLTVDEYKEGLLRITNYRFMY